MTVEEAVRLTREYIHAQFPKDCSSCGRRFASLRDYLIATKHVGQPLSYDAEMGEWTPKEPLGVFSFANCSCGTTLSIDTKEMRLATLLRLMAWAQMECMRRRVSFRDLLEWVRSEIDRQELEQGPGDEGGPTPSGPTALH